MQGTWAGSTHSAVHISISRQYMSQPAYICVCMCVCLCVRVCVRVCVCAHVGVWGGMGTGVCNGAGACVCEGGCMSVNGLAG